MPSNWVIIYTAAGLLQAEIIRSLLEATELPVRLQQESAGAVYALTVGPLGEVEVLVPAEHETEALALVEAYERGDLVAPEESEEKSEDW
jgi:hypothetical protein